MQMCQICFQTNLQIFKLVFGLFVSCSFFSFAAFVTVSIMCRTTHSYRITSFKLQDILLNGEVITLQTMTTGYVNEGSFRKYRCSRWHHEDSREDDGHPKCHEGDEEGRQNRLTPFEKLMQDMSHNEKVVKELTLGKRIAFYRVRGEIGSGNFSQVKLGIHSLTKGRHHCMLSAVYKQPPMGRKMLCEP